MTQRAHTNVATKNRRPLASANLGRRTKQQRAILEIVTNAQKPLSAVEIYDALLQNKIKVSLATAYRTVGILSKKGIIDHLLCPDRSIRYSLPSYRGDFNILDANGNAVRGVNVAAMCQAIDMMLTASGYHVTGFTMSVTSHGQAEGRTAPGAQEHPFANKLQSER